MHFSVIRRLTSYNLRSNSTSAKPDTPSWWSKLMCGNPDDILSVSEACCKDCGPNKIDLAVGIYRDDNGNPHVLPSVLMAEERMRLRSLNKEYVPITGCPKFCDLTSALALGKDNYYLKNKLAATAQGISGTGSLSLGAQFLANFFPGKKLIHLPNPTWSNHEPIFKQAGLTVNYYRYFDSKINNFNFGGALDDIKDDYTKGSVSLFWLDIFSEGIISGNFLICDPQGRIIAKYLNMPENSIILFQASSHNPTGVDPSPPIWIEIAQAVKDRKLLPFFDMAYQGFTSGDLSNDAFAVRHFAYTGQKIAIAQTYSKNMGLYGERIGAFTLITGSVEETQAVLSQLKVLIRSNYSSPPIHGAHIVSEVLSSPVIKAQWVHDMIGMSSRINNMRKQLHDLLLKDGSIRDWKCITDQNGMFCYSGLNTEQVQILIKNFSIYLPNDGRICMAGVNSRNVDYIAHALHEVTK